MTKSLAARMWNTSTLVLNKIEDCKYGHIRQAKGGPGANPCTHPTLETNKQLLRLSQAITGFGWILKLFTSNLCLW